MEKNTEKLVEALKLGVVYSFTKYDVEGNIITIPMGSIYPFVAYQRNNDRKLLPYVILKSPSGKELVFSEPSEIFGSGMVYYNGKLKLRLMY